ncbi:peptidyl-prolyl cis-trans isomerase [Candidatus Sumerlaeota bacterium]|nr:peptidyl-prolyl cis-trans isomerase [Candidatus Sumerlaeota bacterium]HNM46139.1 peptidylprolyl isomerase [Candidatus Sumerlaeota bacterium]
MISQRSPRHIGAIALIALFAAACGGKHATTDATTATPPVKGGESVAVNPFGPPKKAPNGDDVIRQMDFWLALTIPSADGSEGPTAFEAHGYSLTKREYESGLKEFLAGREPLPWLEQAYKDQLAQQFQILRWLERSDASSDLNFRASARRALRERLVNLALDEKSPIEPITDEKLREVYQSRADQYRMQAMVEVRIIQVPTKDDADRVMARLKAGESFATCAATESKHESASRQGQIEPFARGAYTKDFEDAAFALPPGETATVSTNAGVFIIQKIANIPAVSIPFDQVKDALRAELEAKRHKEGMEKLTEQIRKTE